MSNLRVWLLAASCLLFAACGPDGRGALEGQTEPQAEAPTTQSEEALSLAPLAVYTDSLQNGFADWSWATHALTQTAVVHSGAAAISFQANSWQGLNFVASSAIDPNAYVALDFWLYGAAPGGQTLLAFVNLSGGTSSRFISVQSALPGQTLNANTWTHVTLPLSGFAIPAGKAITAIVLQAGTGGTQPTLYVDDMQLTTVASGGSTGASTGTTTGASTGTGATTGTVSTGTSTGSATTGTVSAGGTFTGSATTGAVSTGTSTGGATTGAVSTGTSTGGSGTGSASTGTASTGTTTGTASTGAPYPVYTDSLLNGFADWSWATHSLSQTTVVHTPPDAISFEANGWQGLNFVAPTPLSGAQYKALDFWVYGSTPGGQTILVYFTLSGGTSSKSVRVESYAPGGKLPASAWTHITIPLADLGVQATTLFTAVVLQAGTGGTQTTVYIDDLALISAASGTSTGGTSTGTTGTSTGGTSTATAGTSTGTTTSTTTTGTGTTTAGTSTGTTTAGTTTSTTTTGTGTTTTGSSTGSTNTTTAGTVTGATASTSTGGAGASSTGATGTGATVSGSAGTGGTVTGATSTGGTVTGATSTGGTVTGATGGTGTGGTGGGSTTGAAVAETGPFLHPLFVSHAVLQHTRVALYGWATPGAAVSVQIADVNAQGSATTGSDGRWRVDLGSLPAGGPHTVTVTGPQTVTLTDVLLGEVWLVSGQSNSTLSLNDIATGGYGSPWTAMAQQEVAAATQPSIRLFNVQNNATAAPLTVFGNGTWAACTPSTVASFSAAGYLFAQNLQRVLGVPVGIVESGLGGSYLRQWVPAADLASIPNLPSNSSAVGSQLYNAMIAPLRDASLAGVLWYQGEADASVTDDLPVYQTMLTALMTGWRTRIGDGSLPFVIAQLHNIGPFINQAVQTAGFQAAPVRDAQLRAVQADTDAGLTVNIDIGDADNIHAPNKWDVGARFALQAEALVYGLPVSAWGPIYSHSAVEGPSMRLYFDHADGGLMVGSKVNTNPAQAVPGGALTGFAIRTATGSWVAANAVIDGNTVLVSAAGVTQPAAVRYGWAANPACNLYNGAGLPASPLRTDTGSP